VGRRIGVFVGQADSLILLPQQLTQLGDVGCNAPRLVSGREVGGCDGRRQPSEAPAPVCWLKHAAGSWVDPMQLRACSALHRLIRLWIISDWWFIGPCLHLLACVGAAEDENGHDVRLTSLFATTFHRAQSCSSRRWFSPNGYGAMNGIAESKGHLSDEQVLLSSRLRYAER
jgi:hypothetical protein